MVDFFLHVFDFLQKRRGFCLTLAAVLTAVLIAMVSSLRYNENIYDFLPLSGNEQRAITVYQDVTGGQRIYAMFKAKEENGEQSDRQEEAVDTFAAKIMSNDGKRHISEITTQVDFDKIANITSFLYQNVPFMLSDSDYVRMESLLANPDFADNQLAADVQMMMMPATGFFTPSISNDPLGLFSTLTDRLQARQTSMPFEMDNGYIFTPGKKYAIAMLTSPYGSMESSNNNLLVSYVDSIAEQTMQTVPGVDVAVTGSPVIAVGNAGQIKKDSWLAISIAVTLIMLLLVFSFRRKRSLLLIVASIGFGWLFAMGFISVMRSDVSLIVLGIGSIIIGIAVNYPLHFIAHTDYGGTTREVLKEMVAPLLIGNITTVGAFASLMPLDAPALRDLGFFAAFMLVGTILFVLVFLPHLVKERASAGKQRLSFDRISSISPDRHRWLLWVFLVLTLVFGYFSLGTSFDTNMHNINYMTDEQEKVLSDLQTLAGISDSTNVYVVTEGKTWDEALRKREQLGQMIDSLHRGGAIASYTDVTSFVCSAEEQARRIRKWDEFWDRHRDEVVAMLEKTAPKYGFSNDAFSDFLEIINKKYSPQPFEYFEPVNSVLLSNSFSTSTGCCSVVDVIHAGNASVKDLENTLNEGIGSRGYAFDFAGMNSSIAESLSGDFNYIGFACGFIVFLFLWLSFGRLELSLLAFLPMAMGWLWILGIMYLFGMQFNIVNVILATFIFGQGDDYTIFITDGLISEYAYRKKVLTSFKNSIIISALIMFIGIGSLIVAKHPALHSLAEVTIVGMFTVVLMAWIVPPLIFGWLVKINGKVRREPVTFDQIIRTGCCKVVYFLQSCYGSLLRYIGKLFPDKNKRYENWYHRVVQRSILFDVNHIWGVKSVVNNEYGEDFSRGGLITFNHESKIDLAYLLSLSPRILVKNADQPMDTLRAECRQAIDDGYLVVAFSEKDRADHESMPIHEGTLRLARELNADVLPVFLHGTGHVMPEDNGMLLRGQVNVEVGKRIPADELSGHIHQIYKSHLGEMRDRLENTHYFHHYVISKYTYKGYGVERETRRLLKRYDDFSQWIDGYKPSVESSSTVSVIDAGRGQFSLLFALVNPHLEVHSYSFDPDDADLADCCDPKPANLHVHDCKDMSTALETAAGTNIINLTKIIT
ncbi:MAG: MMPL family transporter [Prevotella sp.]|nr:MMPL family transporter [Prevotella sp.]